MKLETTLRDSNLLDGHSPLRPLVLEGIWLCNQLRLLPNSGERREISNPIIGRDFVSGLLEDDLSVGFFRKSALRLIEFHQSTETSNSLTFTRKTLAEQLQLLQFPALARYGYRDSDSTASTVLLGAARGFLVCDQIGQPALPIAAISQIEIRRG